MQIANTIVRQPILTALLLSVAVHAAMMSNHRIHVFPTPRMEAGRTVVQLTLLPSLPAPTATATPRVTTTSVAEQSQPEPSPAPVKKTLKETAVPPSTEQDSTVEEDKGVESEAVTQSTFHPSYPRISRRRGEEGTVVLSVQVHSNGNVGDVTTLQSSGFHRLDEAAVKAAKRTPFNPALRFGRAIDSTTQLSYTFRLTDD